MTLRRIGPNVAVALYILAAFAMFIISIPNWLLDVLLAFNMAVAFLVLFTVMFSKEVLDMSFFPTLLLFTTIFRIARVLHEAYFDYR